MARSLFLHLSRRAYTAAAEASVKVRGGAQSTKKVVAKKLSSEEVSSSSSESEVYWMRDPKTGNWIPENHVNDIDAAELRQKLLSNKNSPSVPF